MSEFERERYQFQLNYEETDDDDKLLMRRKSEGSFFSAKLNFFCS